MKKIIYTIYLLAAAGVIVLATNSAQSTPRTESVNTINAEFDASVSFFYSSLSPYGEWIEVDAGYYAWRPLRVHRAWRPYLYGRWVWTDFGWYWISTEPFGWAVFHYGRWYNDDYYGWIWIPDRVWGPAWVEWRYNDDYIGWAPLPPYASFSFSIGIRFTTRWAAPMHYWTFVRYRHFNTTSVDRYAASPEYSRRLIGYTRTSSRYGVDRDRIINNGVDRSFIERQGNTRIDRYEVSAGRDRSERVVRDGGRERIEVYRPDTDPNADRNVRVEARRPERRLSLDMERIERSAPERQMETRGGDGRESRGTRIDNEVQAPSRDINREPTRGQEMNRDQQINRGRETERNQRPSIKELLEKRRQEFEKPEERSREQRTSPFYERREMTRERPTGRERVAPPPTQREAPRQAPEVKRGESPKESGSRSEGRKRDRG